MAGAKAWRVDVARGVQFAIVFHFGHHISLCAIAPPPLGEPHSNSARQCYSWHKDKLNGA
eukprot:7451908-Pyramimonas_sp.AAC.1